MRKSFLATALLCLFAGAFLPVLLPLVPLEMSVGMFGLFKDLPVWPFAGVLSVAFILSAFAFIGRKVLYSALILPVLVLPSLASEGQTYSLDGTPFVQLLLPYLEPLVYLVVMSVLGFVSSLAQKYVGVTLDQKHRDTIAMLVRSKLSQIAYEQALAHIPLVRTRSRILKEIYDYVAARGPDALKRFKLSPSDLEKYVMGHFGPEVIAVSEGKSDANISPETAGHAHYGSVDGLGGATTTAPTGA